jgi:Amt family ammonium transporter
LKIIGLFTTLRMPDEQLEIGDLAAHGEEAYPSDEGATLVGAAHAASPTPVVPVRQAELR